MTNVESESKIVSVQALRAVAALAVLIRHVGFWEIEFLAAGVDLFFVISGFIMVVSCWQEFGQDSASRRFAGRRIVRIVPLYWLATFFMMLALFYAKGRVPEPLAILQSLFFYPFLTHSPILPAGWTFEMMFYGMFAVALTMRPRTGVVAVSAALGLLVLLGWILGPVERNNVAFPVSLEFIFGVIIGVGYCEGVRFPKALNIALVILGFVAIGISVKLGLVAGGEAPMRVVAWGVSAALIVIGSTFTQWTWRPIVAQSVMLLGGASFALYLFHQPLILILAELGYGKDAWPKVVLACIAVAVCIHILIERPILSWLRAKRLPTPPRARTQHAIAEPAA